MLSQTDSKQQTTVFTYDEIDRMETKTLSDGKTTTWYYEEQEGHGESVGMLTSVSDPTGSSCEGGRSEQYSYDEWGRSPPRPSACWVRLSAQALTMISWAARSP